MSDPVSLIFAALVAATTKEVVQDAYKKFKELIKQKFEGDGTVKGLIEGKPEDIKDSEKLLKRKLTEVGADKDEEILKAAQEVNKLNDPEGATTGKYDLRGAKGVQVGDRNTQTNTF
ncbi:hypothetical protein [Nostoc sp.]|uniref:hypothetical protein n=1 Tax=Nostoc sp. TaxID=1180 RepID=UPI002FF486C3